MVAMDKFQLPNFSFSGFSLGGLGLGDVPLELVLIAGRAVFLIAAFAVMAMAFLRWRRAAQTDAQRIFEQLDIALSEIRSLSDQTAAVAARLDTLEERLDYSLRAAPAVSSAPQRGYETAVRIARGGAGVEQITNLCGLTRHEAELLVRLHGAGQAGASPATQPGSMRPGSMRTGSLQSGLTRSESPHPGYLQSGQSEAARATAGDSAAAVDGMNESTGTPAPSLSADDAAAARQEVRRRVRSRLSVVS